jgi:hypothetical protein
LIEKIFAIPDGIGGNRRPTRVRGTCGSSSTRQHAQETQRNSLRRLHSLCC